MKLIHNTHCTYPKAHFVQNTATFDLKCSLLSLSALLSAERSSSSEENLTPCTVNFMETSGAKVLISALKTNTAGSEGTSEVIVADLLQPEGEGRKRGWYQCGERIIGHVGGQTSKRIRFVESYGSMRHFQSSCKYKFSTFSVMWQKICRSRAQLEVNLIYLSVRINLNVS